MRLGYVARRLLQLVIVAFGIVVITFLIVHVLGDPAEALAPEGSDPAQIASLRSELGLDRPLPDQFLSYAGGLLRGDLGTSFAQRRPVTSLIGERLRPTLLLTLTALVLSSAAGIALGIVAAKRPFGSLDLFVSSGALVGYAVPSFWLAQIAVLVLALHVRLFPVEGVTDPRYGYTGLAHLVDLAHHLVLPATVLATSEVALLARVTRTGLLQQLGSGYVRTARAKGAPGQRVLSRHALPNACLPVITVIGSRIGFLLSGAVLVETVFAWPGLGSLLVESAKGHDQPVVLGMALFAALGVMVANLATDLLYARVDPRIRYR